MPRFLRTLLPAVLVVLAAGCAAAGQMPKQRIAAAYPDLQIRWLGDYDLAWADDGYVGLERALALVTHRGIAPGRIQAASLQGVMSRSLQPIPTEVTGRPFFFDITLRVAGCDHRIEFRTTATGRIVGERDPGDCLATG